jgi:hypothetical protein
MIWVFYLRFTVPILGVFYGTSLMADEIEDKTVTYLFTRPIRRGAVLVGKYLAYLACTTFVVLPSVTLVYLLVVPMNGSLGGSFLDLIKDLAMLALGLAVYGALFAFIVQVQAPLAHRPRLYPRLGAGGTRLPRVSEEIHGRLLPAVARAPCDAERRRHERNPGAFQG